MEQLTVLMQIKEIRKKNRMTLQQLSQKTNISVNYLSQMERGTANPSIGKIKKVTDALGVKFMSLGMNSPESEPKKRKAEVLRHDMRKMLVYPKSKTKNYLLTPDLQRKLEVIISEVNPGEQDNGEWVSHEGEEFGLVMEGKLEVVLEDETYLLEAGDSIYFKSDIPHKLEAVGDTPCKCIWVITPPSF